MIKKILQQNRQRTQVLHLPRLFGIVTINQDPAQCLWHKVIRCHSNKSCRSLVLGTGKRKGNSSIPFLVIGADSMCWCTWSILPPQTTQMPGIWYLKILIYLGPYWCGCLMLQPGSMETSWHGPLTWAMSVSVSAEAGVWGSFCGSSCHWGLFRILKVWLATWDHVGFRYPYCFIFLLQQSGEETMQLAWVKQ